MDQTTDELTNRISALIPNHPEVLRIKRPFELFAIDEFSCGDLAPTLTLARAALQAAQQRYRDGVK